MRLFMVGAGLLLLLSTVRVRAQARTAPALLYLSSLVCGGLGLIVWVPDNSLAVDALVRVPGVGHLLTIWLITLCCALQFAFITTLANRWSRRRRGAGVLYVVLLTAFTLAWACVHLTLGTRFPTLAYGQYRSGPPEVLGMDLAGSACIIVAALLGAAGYLHFLLHHPRLDERVGALGATAIFAAAATYGALALAQSVASCFGGNGTGLFSLRVPIIGAGAALAPLTIWIVTYLQRFFWPQGRRPTYAALLADVQRWEESLRQREEELFGVRLDLLDAQTLLDDVAARLRHFADPAVVAAVAARCEAAHIPPYEQRVAIEAVIWITTMRDQPDWTPWTATGVPDEEHDMHDAQQLNPQAQQAHAFTADTLRVVLLVLGRRNHPAGVQPRADPPGWRRRIATLIRRVLREHGYDRATLLSHHTHTEEFSNA